MVKDAKAADNYAQAQTQEPHAAETKATTVAAGQTCATERNKPAKTPAPAAEHEVDVLRWSPGSTCASDEGTRSLATEGESLSTPYAPEEA